MDFPKKNLWTNIEEILCEISGVIHWETLSLEEFSKKSPEETFEEKFSEVLLEESPKES